MSISDLEDKSKEAELRRFDVDGNGLLSQDEAYNYIVSKRPDQAGKKLEDVLS
jgi:hypothetical protein